MIYTIPYQKEELLKNNYNTLRSAINPKSDSLHLTVSHAILQNKAIEDIYKIVLKLEGMYRSENELWISEPVKVRVIRQL